MANMPNAIRRIADGSGTAAAAPSTLEGRDKAGPPPSSPPFVPKKLASPTDAGSFAAGIAAIAALRDPLSNAAPAISGLPEASLAAIVTSAGLPDVPAI